MPVSLAGKDRFWEIPSKDEPKESVPHREHCKVLSGSSSDRRTPSATTEQYTNGYFAFIDTYRAVPELDGTVKIYWSGADSVVRVGVADLVALCLQHCRLAT